MQLTDIIATICLIVSKLKAYFFTSENWIPLSVDFFHKLPDNGYMGVQKTSQGFLRFKSRFARTGIQEYSAQQLRGWGVPINDGVPNDAIVRVYRDPEHVFNKDSMKSFENVPITNGHRGTVSPSNFKDLTIGMSLSPVVKDEDGRHLDVDILLAAEDGIRAYKSGVKQLSGGYSSTIKLTGGITDAGEPYDMSQEGISANHIALVPRGRAGTARLLDMRDSTEDDMDPKEELGKMKQQLEDAMNEIKTLKSERDELKGKVDTLESEKLTEDQLAEKIAAGVADAREAEKTREAVITRARLFAPKLKVSDSMSNKDIMVEAIKSRDPSVDISDASEGYIRGRFDALEAPKARHPRIQTRQNHNVNDGAPNGEGNHSYEKTSGILG